MQVSAELRWFWRAQPPRGFEEWFRAVDVHGCAAGGGRTRTDRYLRDAAQRELGMKRRGGRPGVEVKGLVLDAWGRVPTTPFAGPLQLWTKWSSPALTLPRRRTLATRKQRWLRRFDTSRGAAREVPLGRDELPLPGYRFPAAGCNVEWTRVALPRGAVWWTFAFEAFGPIAALERSACLTARTLAARHPPALRGALLASYPSWLQRRGVGGGARRGAPARRRR